MSLLPKNKSLPKKGNNNASNGNPGKKKKHHATYYGGVPGTGYKGVSRRKVRKLTRGILRDELTDLRQQRSAIKKDAKVLGRGIRQQYRKGKGDLSYVHGETTDFLNQLKNSNAASSERAQASANNASNVLQQGIADTYSGSMGAVGSEMARLGIEGGASMDDMASNQSYAMGVAKQNAANTNASFDLSQSNTSGVLDMLSGMNQGSFISGIGQNLNTRNENLTANRDARAENMQSVRDAINKAKLTRPDLVQQLLEQMQQTGWSQYLQADALHKQNQDRRKANHKRKSKRNSSRSKAAANAVSSLSK